MKITGTRGHIFFDFENGYKIKALGELLVNNTFFVYTDTLKNWEPPHDKETISREQINGLIREALKATENTVVKVEFEEMGG